ncbi:hypothetical protein Ptr902_00458 [Pyrenophora tritici-repentis]|nr:hypothetical protein Ptr902_00458 [Pyrenophora tritici-repentis]
MFYNADESVTTNQGSMSDLHPCSHTRMNANPDQKFNPEPSFPCVRATGFFHPPWTYEAGQVRWNYHKNGWAPALAEALVSKGIKTTAAKLEQIYEGLKDSSIYKHESSYVLHQPADRDTAIFQNEWAASMVARWGLERPFSMIIVCPLVRADGIGWGRIYDTHNRPPVYTRWSTGEQGTCEPLILGCLPRHETTKGRESYLKIADWYSLETTSQNPTFRRMWDDLWKTYGTDEIVELIRGCQFSPGEKVTSVFLWCLVRLHRRIALGNQISDANLGSWIKQYGNHLSRCGTPYNPAGRTFAFDPSKPYSGMSFTYNTLTAWLLNPRFGDDRRKSQFVKEWDDAIDAHIQYNVARGDENKDKAWFTFRERMKAASKPFF